MTGKLVSTFTLPVIVFILHGCCKAECINRTLTVSFFKAKAVNTDSVSVLSYAAGTNFSQRIDSTFIRSPVSTADTSFSRVITTIYAERDWKIINHSLHTEYRLNNFDIDKVRCCGEKAYIVRSFFLNGIKQSGDFQELQ